MMTLQVLMQVYNNLGLWDKLTETANKVLATDPADKTAQDFLKATRIHGVKTIVL